MAKLALTDEAARKILEFVRKEGGERKDPGLRVKLVGGGCSGYMYQYSLEDGPGETDEVVEHNGARLFVDRKSMFFLGGSVLDYEESLMNSGFRVQNPNAKGSCGCGESVAF
ncbi:MAG: HesB/IscA family protein [Planctomycetota bacterium]